MAHRVSVPQPTATRRQRVAVTTERRLFSATPDWRPQPPPVIPAAVREVALDFETTGLAWWGEDVPVGVAIGWMEDGRPRTQYLPTGHADGNLPLEQVVAWLRGELRGRRIKNLGLKFDLHMAHKWDVDLEALGCSFADVGHWAALLDDHRRQFGLDVLGKHYVGEGKVEGLDKSRMRDYHAGEVAPYAEQDVRLALLLGGALWPQLGDQDLHRVRELEEAVLPVVVEMERNGAVLDEELLDRWLVETEREYLRLVWEVRQETGITPDPDSAACWERLFHHLGLPITVYTGKYDRAGNPRPSFADDVLAAVPHPTVQKLRRAGKLRDLRSKYLVKYKMARCSDGLLRYALHQLMADDGGTVSGRFSSAGLTQHMGVNIQQVFHPKKQLRKFGEGFPVRQLFVPGSGLFLSADAKQIEYRLFAHYSNSEKILSRYRENPETDFHNIVMEMVQAVRADITREQTKDLNFAQIFGAGLGKVAWMLGLTDEQAAPFVAAYRARFPEAGELIRRSSKAAEVRGYVRTVMGRRARFPGAQYLHKALNRVIQGSAADINKLKLVELHRERKHTGLKLRMTIHDEVCGDVPDRAAAERVRAVLDRQNEFVGPDGRPFRLRVPILWDVGTGSNWYEPKSGQETGGHGGPREGWGRT